MFTISFIKDSNLQPWQDVQDQPARGHVQVEAALVLPSPGEVVLFHVVVENLLHKTLLLEICLENETKLAVRVHSRWMSFLERI